jgi:hypothetical protein
MTSDRVSQTLPPIRLESQDAVGDQFVDQSGGAVTMLRIVVVVFPAAVVEDGEEQRDPDICSARCDCETGADASNALPVLQAVDRRVDEWCRPLRMVGDREQLGQALSGQDLAVAHRQ